MNNTITEEDIIYGQEEIKLAHLLINNVIFINNGHWNNTWPKDKVTLHVNCNDVFAWGCADSEDISFSEINDLYQMVQKDPDLGSVAWCIKKRKCMPQDPLIKIFKKAGIWNLKELIK